MTKQTIEELREEFINHLRNCGLNIEEGGQTESLYIGIFDWFNAKFQSYKEGIIEEVNGMKQTAEVEANVYDYNKALSDVIELLKQ